MAASFMELPDDIMLHLLESYLFIPLNPRAQLGPNHVLSGRTTDALAALSLTCRRFSILSRSVVFRDLRLKRRLNEEDLEILQFVGPHIKRLALDIYQDGPDLATVLIPLARLRSLFITHGIEPQRVTPKYGDLAVYSNVAHLSLDYATFLPGLLDAFPALQTLQLSPYRGIASACPAHTALRRLKLFSIQASFGRAEMHKLAETFPGITEFEARFEKASSDQLRMRWKHDRLREWLRPVLALPIHHLSFGYFSIPEHQDDVANTSRMLAEHCSTLQSLTWRHRRRVLHASTRRIADLLVADHSYSWDLFVTELEIKRGQRNVEVAIIKDYQIR